MSLWKFFVPQEGIKSKLNIPTQPKVDLIQKFYACPRYCKFEEVPLQTDTALKICPDNNFSYKPLRPFVGKVFTVLNHLSQNNMQSIPHLNNASHQIWSRLASCFRRYLCLKVWKDDDNVQWMTDDGPSLYYKLNL